MFNTKYFQLLNYSIFSAFIFMVSLSPLSAQVNVSCFAGTGGDGNISGYSQCESPTLKYPAGIVQDASGTIYIADSGNHKIRKISSSGILSTVAGSGTTGSADGIGTAASFWGPTGIAIDQDNNLIIADAGNNKIRKITPAGVVSTIAGSGTTGTADGAAASATFFNPTNVCIDKDGNIFISDNINHTIRKLTPSGIVSTFAGTGTSGFTDGAANIATFGRPRGLAFDKNGNLFVADEYYNQIRKITPLGIVTTFAGSKSSASVDGTGTAASFYNPFGITFDAAENLYVAERTSSNIRKITPAGVVTTLAGISNITAKDGAKNIGGFNSPYDLIIDASGNILVADNYNNKIKKLNPAGVVSTFAGSGLPGSLDGDISSANLITSFYGLKSIVADEQGNLYVSDQLSNVIKKITPMGITTTFAGTGERGDELGNRLTAKFIGPSGLTRDQHGNLFVIDAYNYKIKKITPAGIVTTVAGSGVAGSDDGQGAAASFKYCTHLTVDSSGNLYVVDTDNRKIRKISPTGYVTTLAGTGLSGDTDGPGNVATFRYISGIAVDANGNLFVTDIWNAKIKKITPAGVVSTFTGSGASGNFDGIGPEVSFNGTSAIKIAKSGMMYIVERGQHTIRTITPEGLVTTIAGNGVRGDIDAEGLNAGFADPEDLAVDNDGNIYVTDVGNNKIRKISTSSVSTSISTNSFTNSDIVVYPNPVKNNLHVLDDSFETAQIMNSAGEIILSVKITDNTIDVSSLSSGLYFINLTNAKGTVGKKFIKD